jgi:hypothetical protein
MVWLFVEVRKRREVRIGRVEEVNGACKIDRIHTSTQLHSFHRLRVVTKHFHDHIHVESRDDGLVVD